MLLMLVFLNIKVMETKTKLHQLKNIFNFVRSYLSDIINDHKTQGEWKIQLIMTISFISFKESNDARIMHTKSINIKIMIGNETDKIIR